MIQIPIDEIFLALMAFTRVTAMFFILPIFSTASFPIQARLGLSGGIALMLVPSIVSTPMVPTHVLGLILAFLGELVIGLLLGLAGRLFFFAVDFACELIAREAALMQAKSFDPTTLSQASVFTPLYFFLVAMVFLQTGVHLEVIAAFVRSYDFVPAGLGLFTMEGVDHITRSIGGIFELGLRIAAPLMAMSFIINVVFAILGKVAQKVNVMILSFGIRIMLSILLLSMSVSLMLRFILDGLDRTGFKMLEFIVAR